MEQKVDGAALCRVKSAEDLTKLCGIPSEDARIIFDSVRDLSEGIGGKIVLNEKFTLFDYSIDSKSESDFVNAFNKTQPDFYEPLEESLESAGFVNIKSMLKYSREMAAYLEKEGTLKKYGMTTADAIALMIYTYDNGTEHLEENPFRIVNKAFGERNNEKLMDMRGYILRLISALRKLPGYSEGTTLYRSVTKVGKKSREVGSILSWPAFTSTSADEGVIIDFNKDYEEEEGKCEKCIFEIRGCFKGGHSIRDFSFHQCKDGINTTLFRFYFHVYFILCRGPFRA